jgi:hypothetical protein
MTSSSSGLSLEIGGARGGPSADFLVSGDYRAANPRRYWWTCDQEKVDPRRASRSDPETFGGKIERLLPERLARRHAMREPQ